MTVILVGVSAALFAVLLHGSLARWLAPSFYVKAIAVCCLVSLLAAALLIRTFDVNLTAADSFLVAVLAASLVAVYALVFMGIAWDSPTLALANEIADHGPAGMPVGALDNFVQRHPFVSSRIEAMVRSGVLADDGEFVSARGNVGLLVKVAETYRCVCSRSDQIG
jgi:hypothetical protein